MVRREDSAGGESERARRDEGTRGRGNEERGDEGTRERGKGGRVGETYILTSVEGAWFFLACRYCVPFSPPNLLINLQRSRNHERGLHPPKQHISKVHLFFNEDNGIGDSSRILTDHPCIQN